MTDENGDKWDFERAENIETNFYNHPGTPFASKFSKIVKIAFKPTADAKGAIFSAVIPHYKNNGDRFKQDERKEFEALFRDIRVTK